MNTQNIKAPPHRLSSKFQSYLFRLENTESTFKIIEKMEKSSVKTQLGLILAILSAILFGYAGTGRKIEKVNLPARIAPSGDHFIFTLP